MPPMRIWPSTARIFPASTVSQYESGLYPFIEERYPQVFSGLNEKQEITDDIEKVLNEALEAYNKEFEDTIK